MSLLQITIDRVQAKLYFKGPGTFQAKEAIKQLGVARWNAVDKVWEVSDCAIDVSSLRSVFPDSELVELDGRNTEQDLFESPPVESVSGGKIPDSLTVEELCLRLRKAISAQFPATIFIRGVIRSVSRSKGRVFVDLSDGNADRQRVSCVIWREEERLTAGLKEAGFALEENLQVMFEVEVGLSKLDTRVSLQIKSIVSEYTLAKLAAERELTNAKLEKEGIFDANKQRPMAFLPRRLGVLTSASGTVINDFRASLEQAKFGFELFWLPVSVQGARAAKELELGIQYFSSRSDIDALLIFRGGGSAAELSVFNQYEVARAVCLCPHPVVSAIGHQRDQSSVQDASWLACGVPKDIGRYFCDRIIEVRSLIVEAIGVLERESLRMIERDEQRLLGVSRLLRQSLFHLLSSLEQRMIQLLAVIPRQAGTLLRDHRTQFKHSLSPISALAERQVSFARSQLSSQAKSSFRLMEILVERKVEVVSHLKRLVEQADPKVQLQRGFALVHQEKEIITKGARVSAGESVEIEFVDRKRQAKILD